MGKFCSECGTKIEPGAKFCSSCGAKTAPAGDAAAAPAPTPAPAAARKPCAAATAAPKKEWVPPAEKPQADMSHAYGKDRTAAQGYGAELNNNKPTESLPLELDLTHESLKKAWRCCTSDRDDTNWVVFGLGDGKQLVSVAQGSGGLTQLKKELDNRQHKVLWGAFKVIGKGMADRHRYVYFSFVGSGVAELTKAQANPLKRKVEPFFGAVNLSLDVYGAHLDQITINSVGLRLFNASGSHKDKHFDFGGGDVVATDTLKHHSDDESESEEDFD